MQVPRHHFLTRARGPGDQDAGFGRRDLVGHLDQIAHARVGIDDVARFFGNGLKDRRDQFRVRRHGYVFLGPGLDRADRGLAVGADAAGDDGQNDPLAFQRRHQPGDVGLNVDHDQVGALA